MAFFIAEGDSRDVFNMIQSNCFLSSALTSCLSVYMISLFHKSSLRMCNLLFSVCPAFRPNTQLRKDI